MTEDGVSDYERIRNENIRRNEEFLQSVGLDSSASAMRSEAGANAAALKAQQASKRGVSSRKRKSDAPEPMRRSGRVTIDRLKAELADLDPKDPQKIAKEKELQDMEQKKKEGSYSTIIDESAAVAHAERYSRFSEEELPAIPTNLPEDTDAEKWTKPLILAFPLPHSSFSSSSSSSSSSASGGKKGGAAKGKFAKATPSKATSAASVEQTPDSYAKAVAALAVKEQDVAKVTENRVTSVWVHPSESKLIIAAGDKSGNLGIWDVDATAGGVGGVYKYKPSVSNICRLWGADRLHVASYDGTVRFLDLTKNTFVRAFESPDSMDDMYYTDVDATSSTGAWYVTRSDGTICSIDSRASASKYAWKTEGRFKMDGGAAVDAGKMNSVQSLPGNEHLIVAAGGGKRVFIFDIRKVSSSAIMPVTTMAGHEKSINAAYASADGQYILSVCQDNTIRLWSDFATGNGAPKVGVTKHDNHTGRWLSTFRPTWDPKHASAVCLGSMEQPRRVEIWSASRDKSSSKPVMTLLRGVRADCLASVCSRNAFHPTLNIVAATNSSGRVHILR